MLETNVLVKNASHKILHTTEQEKTKNRIYSFPGSLAYLIFSILRLRGLGNQESFDPGFGWISVIKISKFGQGIDRPYKPKEYTQVVTMIR